MPVTISMANCRNKIEIGIGKGIKIKARIKIRIRIEVGIGIVQKLFPMDIAIRPVGKTSGLSETPFHPGDVVWSYLYRTSEGFIDRLDILEEERDQLELEGPVICRWSQQIKEKEVSEAEERRSALQSADEVFLSLFEEPGESEEAPMVDAARDRLKFFLALQLERKRILKPLGGRRFRHMPTKRELTVPDLEISPELIAGFQEEISLMGVPR